MSGLDNISVQGYVDKEMAPAEVIRESFNEERGLKPSFQGRPGSGWKEEENAVREGGK